MSDLIWFVLFVILLAMDFVLLADLSPACVLVMLFWIGFGGSHGQR